MLIYTTQFDVTLAPPGADASRPPKIYQIKITKVAEINPEYVTAHIIPATLLIL
jgi:hypothetical protein